MKVRSLIDDKRKQRIRDAIAKGDESVFRKKKAEPESGNLRPAKKQLGTDGHDTITEPAAKLYTPRPVKKAVASAVPLSELNRRLIEGAQNGDILQVEDALDDGANIEAMNTFDWSNTILIGFLYTGTALIWAVEMNKKDIVDLLIARGANLNAVGNEKVESFTALMRAAKRGNDELVELLIMKGADIEAEDSTGKTAFKYALMAGQNKTAALLKKLGAKGEMI